MLRPFSKWSQALRDPRESPPETPSSQHVHHTPNIVAMGPRRRSRRAPPPGAGFTVITPGTAGGPGVSQAGIPAAGITIGHVDTLVVYTGSGAVTAAAGITIGHVDTLIVHTEPGPVTDAGRDPEPGS